MPTNAVHHLRVISTFPVFAPGTILHLDERQAKARALRIERLGPGEDSRDGPRFRVRVTTQIGFKRGEVIGVEGDLGKTWRQHFESLDGDVQPTKSRADQILEALLQLQPANKRHFTAAGLPRTSALKDILGFDVSAQERDEAIRRKAALKPAVTEPEAEEPAAAVGEDAGGEDGSDEPENPSLVVDEDEHPEA